MALRGVRMVVAVTIMSELGDLTRFDNPKQLMSFLGLTPSEHSSGDKKKKGAITKTGNQHARRVLVEAQQRNAEATGTASTGDTRHCLESTVTINQTL